MQVSECLRTVAPPIQWCIPYYGRPIDPSPSGRHACRSTLRPGRPVAISRPGADAEPGAHLQSQPASQITRFDKTERAHYVVLIIAVFETFRCYHSGMYAAGYILAGGRSTRMGRDKALLPWHGQPALLHMIRLVEAAMGTTAISARPAVVLGPDTRYRSVCHAACWDDLQPGLGPLGGLETALTKTRSDWNLLVSIDIPGVPAALLRSLIEAAPRSSAQAIVVRDPGGAGQVHPLCAIYHRSCLAAVQASLRVGDYRMMNLLKRLTIDHMELAVPLENLNCPEDWLHASDVVTL